MTSNRPYLLRALNEWILDNDLTPYVMVDAEAAGVQVPSEYAQDGKIVLNISPSAVRELLINNDSLSFNARFAGRPYQVYAPIATVLAIYAKESGNGVVFPEEDEAMAGNNAGTAPGAGKPHLQVVK